MSGASRFHAWGRPLKLHTAPRALLLSCAGLLVFASAASAQRAPIVFAGQGGSSEPAQVASLEGGDENSYGYGAAPRSRSGALIDLRRPNNGAPRITTVAAEQPVPLIIEPEQPRQPAAPRAPSTGEGPQSWLERERVGPPYEANGQWYVPTPEPGYAQTGTASWYGPQFHGQRTASGEVFDQEAMTAAHPTLPIPSLVQVTNLENGREVVVRVNDRGPFVGGRLIDLSHAAAEVLGFEQAGQARVHVRYLGPAPRRVNADGSTAPASSASPPAAPLAAASAQAYQAEEVPRSLLPPSAPSSEHALSGAPIGEAPYSPPPQRSYSHAAPAAGDYFVQVGAFTDLANAHRVRDAVGAAGPVVVDVRRSGSGGELFRVRVGPWTNREEADAARRNVANLGYGESIIAAR
jgi:rare lipoprotein A